MTTIHKDRFVILNSDDFVTPIAAQRTIRAQYHYTRTMQVEVRKINEMYDVYRSNMYQFTVNEEGEID